MQLGGMLLSMGHGVRAMVLSVDAGCGAPWQGHLGAQICDHLGRAIGIDIHSEKEGSKGCEADVLPGLGLGFAGLLHMW